MRQEASFINTFVAIVFFQGKHSHRRRKIVKIVRNVVICCADSERSMSPGELDCFENLC